MRGAQGTFLSPDSPEWVWGQRRIYTVPAPAAGAEWAFTAQPSMLTRIITVSGILTASAQAASRFPGNVVLDGDKNILGNINTEQEVVASTVIRVSAVRGISAQAIAKPKAVTNQVPDLLLEPGYQYGSNTPGIQTEDQFGAVLVWVEEYEQNPHHPMEELAAEVAKIIKAERALSYATE